SLPEFCVYFTNDMQSPWKGRLESALRGVPLRQSQYVEDALTQAAGVVFLDQSVEASVLEALSMLSASPMHPPVVFLGSQEEIPENMRAIFASTALSESDTDDRVEEAVRRAMIEQAGKLS